MSLTAESTLRSNPRGEAWTAILALDRPEQHDFDYLRTLFIEAPGLGLDPAFVAAQWSHETGKGTSVRWNRDKNPAGIGIPQDDTPQPFPIANGVEAALIHLAALAILTTRATPAAAWWDRLPSGARHWLTTVWIPHVLAGPAVGTVADLNLRYPDRQTGPHATWAWDADYAAKVVRHFDFLFPVDPALPIEVNLVPTGQCNTPDILLNKDGDLWITVHENGNPRSGARDERAFVAGARNGDGSCRPSYHVAVDAERAVQIRELDRIGHHAADGCDNRATDLGCFQSVAIETCQLAPLGSAEWERTLRNLVRLIVAIKVGDPRVRYGRTSPARFRKGPLAQHNTWYPVKNCPERIRNTSRWQSIVWAVELALAPPVIVVPVPEPPPEPVPEPEPDELPAKPSGMSDGLIADLYGSVEVPWGTVRFAWEDAAARFWYRRAVASIPTPGRWWDGRWPRLLTVVHRGDGRLVYAWSDGSILEMGPGQ